MQDLTTIVPPLRSALFIQNSIIKEECRTVCSAAPQTYHNQSKISNHLRRLYLFLWTESSLVLSLSVLLVALRSQDHPSAARALQRRAFLPMADV